MKTEAFAELLGDVQEDYVHEARFPTGTKAHRKPVSRWVKWAAAAACLCVVLASAALWKTTAGKAPVLPPTRTGASSASGSLARKYTFETAFADADAVACIRVGDWLGENTEILSTYYEATVLECFKGDLSGTFTLIQDGCSVSTLKGYPLFTSGNEMLVFLKEATESDKEATGLDYDDLYWIIGSFTTLMDLVSDEDGNRYFGDRCGVLSETLHDLPNYAKNAAIAQSVFSCMSAADPLVKSPYSYLYAEEELLSLLRAQ